MKNREAIIEKIKKLLRLAKSSNEHEAALAAARAQELLAKHNLDESEFSDRELPKEAAISYTDTVKKPASWVYLLASSVAGAFDCGYFFRTDGRMCFVGVDIDHEIASYTFSYLYRTIGRLACQFMAKSQQRRLTLKGKKKVRLSYCLGAASVVSRKLKDQHEQTPITTMALVPVKEALIKAKLEEHDVITKEREKEDISDRAYWNGVHDGKNIDHGRRAVREKKQRPLRIEFQP
jgi:hypothetical protein